MKKYLVLLLLLLVSQVSTATVVDIMPLQLQFRYEDTVEQMRSTQQYQAYGLAVQINPFRFELELSQRNDTTGNASLSIEKNTQEILSSAGYQAFEIKSSSPELNLSLALFLNIWLGSTKTSVETKMLGMQSSSSSNNDLVLGAGGSLVGRFSYAIIETDFKVVSSKNMSPQEVPVLSLKLGVGIPF